MVGVICGLMLSNTYMSLDLGCMGNLGGVSM